MEQNRISERGSYDELLRHNGAFAQFMRTHLTELVANDEEGAKNGLYFHSYLVIEMRVSSFECISVLFTYFVVEKEKRVLERALSHLSANSDEEQPQQQDAATKPDVAKLRALKRRRSRKTTTRSDVTTREAEEEKSTHKAALLEEETMEEGTVSQ